MGHSVNPDKDVDVIKETDEQIDTVRLPEEDEKPLSQKVFGHPVYLLFLTLGAIFSAEIVIMLILAKLPSFTVLREALIDSILLVVVLFPILYFFVHKPLRSQIIHLKQLKENLHALSITDELTGLLNRRGFLRFAQRQIEIAHRHKTYFAILYLDLNDMKTINDEFGHREGDQALRYITDMLNKTFRSSDIIARMGGDEFAIFMTGARGRAVEKAVIDNVLANLRHYNENTERGYKLSVSTGIVYYDPADPCSLEDLLLRADTLMYESKQRYQFEKAGLKQPKKITREKRIAKRYTVENNYKIELVVPENIRIVNISMIGICLETRQRLTKNTPYSIRISLDHEGEEILLTGFVVWSTVEEKVTEQGNRAAYHQTGLRFIGMEDNSKNILKKYLGSVRKGNFALSLFQ